MRRLHELYQGDMVQRDDEFLIPGYRSFRGLLCRVNVLALGNVGGNLALALKLLGRGVVSEIGISDIDPAAVARWEMELNQVTMPDPADTFPKVRSVSGGQILDCDVFVFCASKGVPDHMDEDVDVRMAQLESNRELVRIYAEQAVRGKYDGEFFIVSDPVDPLCKEALRSGIRPEKIQGFGLGVMNGRAAYYAAKDDRFSRYLDEGRVFGPHGDDLVVADSVMSYDPKVSKELTKLTTDANMAIRRLGYKPFIAPAISSGAVSILENIRGGWQYSSAFFGKGKEGAFLGMLNKRTPEGLVIEDLPMDERLFARIKKAYENLEKN